LPESSRSASTAGGDVHRRFDRFGSHDVDHLDDLDAGQGGTDRPVGARRDRIHQLERVDPATTLLFDDVLGLGPAGQEDAGDFRWDRIGNLRDQLLGDDADATGHVGDKTDRRRAVRERERDFLSAGDTTDLDAWLSVHASARIP
jgi:hypothetical protein